MVSAVQRILVIKLCCIGDILQLTPTLRNLKAANPNAEITMLVSRWVEALVKGIPAVSNYILYDAPYSKSLLRKILETITTIYQVRKRKYDLVLVGHRNKVSGAIALLSGARTRVGFDGVPFLTNRVLFEPNLHEATRYQSLLAPLGIQPTINEAELKANPEDEIYVEKILSKHGVQSSSEMIGVFPGGGENPGTSMTIKRWHPEKYIKLIELLVREYDLPVILVGESLEWELNESIRKAVEKLGKVLNVAGSLNLGQLIALAKKCSLFIGGDSGPTHIAAAVGTPTVAIFGPSDPRLVAPRGRNHRYVWKQVECSPCYTPRTVLKKSNFDGKKFLCWTGTHACIKEISVDDVYSVVQDLMNEIARDNSSRRSFSTKSIS